MSSFVIPADYCVALIDVNAYSSFVDRDWTFPQLKKHFVAQMNLGTMLAWGTGASGNWQIALASDFETTRGFREFTHRISATGTKLYLTSYDELTMAAQFKKIRLPQQGTEDWFFPIEPGDYECRVVQLYNPTEAQSEEVFNQKTPHFLIELSSAEGPKQNKINEVPWFDELD